MFQEPKTEKSKNMVFASGMPLMKSCQICFTNYLFLGTEMDQV